MELNNITDLHSSSLTDDYIFCPLFRCDLNGDGHLDYTEFTKYLTSHGSSAGRENESADLISTNTATYSNPSQVHNDSTSA